MRDVIEKHIVKPDKDAGEMTLQEVNCYIAGIMDHAGSGGSNIVKQARDYAQEHGEGN